MDFGAKFEEGLSYTAFLDQYGNDEHRRRWGAVHEQVQLSDEQRRLLAGFQREMKVLVVAGTWCGDCVDQCPIFAHFEAANDRIRIRYFDRDDQTELSQRLSLCGGQRVPSVLFLSEDNHVCGRYGDRTLVRYRQLAAQKLGDTCPTGLSVPDGDVLAQVTAEWLDQFERIQLMLRTSGRLRELHGD